MFRLHFGPHNKDAALNALVVELIAFAPKHSGYVGARSYSILAGIYADKKAWEDAENAWTNAAKAGAKTYLAAVSLFNAAVAAEEQGNIPRAIELYTQSVALADVFPAASRAQFSIGRLQEEQHNKDAALEAYRQLVNKWPQDIAWTNWAQSRIIMLTAR
jgi:tetratricopeptide (TPR) repeat protein